MASPDFYLFMKILIGTNTLTQINGYVYSNHSQFWYRLGKHRPEDKFIFFTPPRMTIDTMRNTAAKVALENECDYLMFIDDDVLIPFDALDQLLAMQYDIAAGFTIIRGYPYDVMFFKEYKENGQRKLSYFNDYRDFTKENGIVDCGAVGFSCVLIKCELMKKISLPLFITGSQHTEDVYFCLKAREYVPECTIGVQTKLITGHVGEPKIFTPENREYYQRLDEFEMGSKPVDQRKNDRGKEYLEKCNIKL